MIAATMKHIPSVPLILRNWVEHSSNPLLNHRLFLLENWQWLGLALSTGFALLTGLVALMIARFILKRTTLKVNGLPIPNLTDLSLSVGIFMVGWSLKAGVYFLELPEHLYSGLGILAHVVMTTGLVVALWRCIQFIQTTLSTAAPKSDGRMDALMASLISRTLTLLLGIIAALLYAKALGFQVSSLLAGVGLGGLAVAMAAKDTLANIFGSLGIVMDKLFRTGDVIKIGELEGSVESVSFRNTKIRTPQNSLLTIPNSMVLTSPLDNLGVRTSRRLKTTFTLPLSVTPDKIEAFCAGIKTLILKQPLTKKEGFYVSVTEVSSLGYTLQVICQHKTKDYDVELSERHRLMLDIVRLAHVLDIPLTPQPTTTINAKSEQTPDPAQFTSKTEQDKWIAFGKEQAERLSDEFGTKL